MAEVAQGRAEEERRRLIDAFTKLAAESGFECATGVAVADRAGLPAAAFYEHFPSELLCLIAAHDAFFDRLKESVVEVIDPEDEWPAMVRKAVAECLECLADSDRHARLFVVEAVRAGPTILERRFAYTAHLAECLRAGRGHFPSTEPLAETTEWALVAGALACVTSHLLAEQVSHLPSMGPDLTEFLLVPYLGPEKAAAAASAEPTAGTARE